MKYIFIITISLFQLLWSSQVLAESKLRKIAKADSTDVVQLFFSFDTPPTYTSRISNRRLDVILNSTVVSEGLQLFSADEKIVRSTIANNKGDSVISFFFRYQPQNVKISISRDRKLVVEVLLGNMHSKSYQKLSEKLKGLTIADRTSSKPQNPWELSFFKDDWRMFFSEYESDLEISVPLIYTLPPFPAITLIPPGLEQNSEILPNKIYELAALGLFNEILPIVKQYLESSTDEYQKKLLALCYGEVLLRNGHVDGAYRQLALLWKHYPDEHIGIVAKYLLTLLQARHKDPFLASVEFGKLGKNIIPSSPLAPYFLLSQIENGLDTEQFTQMGQLLRRDDVPFPTKLLKIRELRQADYYTATKQNITNFVAYTLLQDKEILFNHPYSLHAYCQTLYSQKDYTQAAKCYQQLSPLVTDSSTLSLISFRRAMATSRLESGYKLVEDFLGVAETFAGTAGAWRATIKSTDLKYLRDKDWAEVVAKTYKALSEKAIDRAGSAEAAFKEALVYVLENDKLRGIDLLLQFLKNFKISELRQSAYALLIEIVPEEINRLISSGEYMQALVLAKKNKELFDNNWLDLDILADIAAAYTKVEIFTEARRVYLYLIEIAGVEDKEQFFLPLVQSCFNNGEYSLVDDFASQYFYNYPKGSHSEAILILQLKSLIAMGRYENGLAILPTPLPENAEIHNQAAILYFYTADYRAARDVIKTLSSPRLSASVEIRFILAESHYQLDEHDDAASLFSGLISNAQFAEQALYRLAELELKQGNEQSALKLYQQIVEIGKDSLWRKSAERQMEYHRLNAALKRLLDS